MHFFSWQTWSNFKTLRTNGAPYLLHCTNGTYAIKSMEIKTRRSQEGLRDFDFGIKFTWFCHQDFCMLTLTITFFIDGPTIMTLLEASTWAEKKWNCGFNLCLTRTRCIISRPPTKFGMEMKPRFPPWIMFPTSTRLWQHPLENSVRAPHSWN
jgi:hypothetical protein